MHLYTLWFIFCILSKYLSFYFLKKPTLIHYNLLHYNIRLSYFIKTLVCILTVILHKGISDGYCSNCRITD